jgi:hypothetical protein
MRSRRLVPWAAAAALALTAAPASAATIPGSPLTVHVGDQGQLQAFRGSPPTGIFYPSTSETGDAGFFLAFPTATPPALESKVFSFQGSSDGPGGLPLYTPVSQSPVTGSGSGADPFRLVTGYAVEDGGTRYAEITQTTTYVNGTQEFRLRWDVENVSSGPLSFKALTAADFFFDGSDRGTGIFTEGPPRFIGGTNADTGNSGGLAEVLGGSSPEWTSYQALEWGGLPHQVWGKVENAAASPGNTFDNTVLGESTDNAGGVEWRQAVESPLAPPQTRTFELVVRNAVPSALQLNPTNAGAPKGVPVRITATAKDTDGRPYAGRTLRWTITGVNPGSGSVALGADGTGVITDPGTNAGNDTIVAYVDFNNDGVRQDREPQASALATFVDNVAPSCIVRVSGDRPGGGGAGKPLVITVNCNEQATVTVATTLQAPRARSRRSDASVAQRRRRRPVRIKLRTTTAVVAPGQAVPVRIKIPKSVRRRYAGKTLKATITTTVRDAAGNTKTITTRRNVKLAKYRKARGRR